MGTWICHLRVAEQLFYQIQGLEFAAFIAGSLAPDSGVPNETWTDFDPPKSVTHYLKDGFGEDRIRDLEFYNAYLKSTHPGISGSDQSFLWGYFFHLLTDRLWVDAIWEPTRLENIDMIMTRGELETVNTVKEDWYDLDHKFLRDHPDWQPWQTFLSIHLTATPIVHIPLPAIQSQFERIKDYYSSGGENRNLNRGYPYLNEATMNRFIFECADSIFKIYTRLWHRFIGGIPVSAIGLLSPEEHAAFMYPLGDRLN